VWGSWWRRGEDEHGRRLKRGCFMVRRLALWRYGAKVVVVGFDFR